MPQFQCPRVGKIEKTAQLQWLKQFHFFFISKNSKSHNLTPSSELIHQNTFITYSEERNNHFQRKKVKESLQRTATVARKKTSSNRTIQRSIQVKVCTIQLHFMSRCFLVSQFVPIRAESWSRVLILKLCSLRFCFSVMFLWKLLAYLKSLWKNEQNHIWFDLFREVFVAPVTGVVTGKYLLRRRRWSTVFSGFSIKFECWPLDLDASESDSHALDLTASHALDLGWPLGQQIWRLLSHQRTCSSFLRRAWSFCCWLCFFVD
jgi:hypothetical protein